MTDDSHALSPEFAELGEQIIDAKARAYANLVDIEERLNSIQNVAVVAVGQLTTDLDPTNSETLLTSHQHASFDFDILSAMARPLEQVREHSGLFGLDGGTNVETLKSAEAGTEEPKDTEPRLPRSDERARRRSIQDVADDLLRLVIIHNGQLDRHGNDRSVLKTAQRDLGATDHYARSAVRILEDDGLITVETIYKGGKWPSSFILNEIALQEAVKRGELSPAVLAALAKRGKSSSVEALQNGMSSEESTKIEPTKREYDELQTTGEENTASVNAVVQIEEDEVPVGVQPSIKKLGEEPDVLEPKDEVDEDEELENTPDKDEVDMEMLDEDEEEDDGAQEIAMVDEALRQSRATKGLQVHLSSARSRRADATERGQKVHDAVKRQREKDGREMNFWIPYENGMFNARMSAKKFSELPASERLLLSVILVRSAKFASIYDTKEKIQSYVLSVVNKNRDKDNEDYIDEDGLDELITTAAQDGHIVEDELGPQLTQEGIDLLHKKKKAKHWW